MGRQNQGVIEINGKKYDTITGKLLTNEHVPAPTNQKSTLIKSGVVMDGFVKRKHVESDRQQHPVSIHKKLQQKSNTLMRSTVKKPAAKHSAPVQIQASIQKSQLNAKPARRTLSSIVQKSSLISHYGDVQARSSVVKKLQPLEVKQQKTHAPSAELVAQHVQKQQPQGSVSSPRGKTTNAFINKALSNASSHELPRLPAISHKRRHKLAFKLGVSSKALSISTGVIAAVMLSGFFAMQNVPVLSMRVAATRAGFDASMPGYKPAGFSFKGPIKYSPGQVSISFKSNIDDRNYQVTQKSSSWNSDALLANFIVTENKQYQTYLDRGRTLYIYDGSNATWVDNGIWHKIEGASNMTTDQLVRIAASI